MSERERESGAGHVEKTDCDNTNRNLSAKKAHVFFHPKSTERNTRFGFERWNENVLKYLCTTDKALREK